MAKLVCKHCGIDAEHNIIESVETTYEGYREVRFDTYWEHLQTDQAFEEQRVLVWKWLSVNPIEDSWLLNENNIGFECINCETKKLSLYDLIHVEYKETEKLEGQQSF